MEKGSYFKDTMRVSLLNTNYNALSEQQLVAFLGDFQWQSISKTIEIPLSQLRTIEDKEVYGTFFYIEIKIPLSHSLKKFRLDDEIDCFNFIRGFKNISVKGEIIFDRKGTIEESDLLERKSLSLNLKEKHPYVIFGNIFISPQQSNENLKIASSVNGNFKNFINLPNEENPYNITRSCKELNGFGTFDPGWERLSSKSNQAAIYQYRINPDRDSNGAGLVYFSNYIAFMDQAERQLMENEFEIYFSQKNINSRSTIQRKLAYYGNASLADELLIEVEFFQNRTDRFQIGLKHSIRRGIDKKLICISECVKQIDH